MQQVDTRITEGFYDRAGIVGRMIVNDEPFVVGLSCGKTDLIASAMKLAPLRTAVITEVRVVIDVLCRSRIISEIARTAASMPAVDISAATRMRLMVGII